MILALAACEKDAPTIETEPVKHIAEETDLSSHNLKPVGPVIDWLPVPTSQKIYIEDILIGFGPSDVQYDLGITTVKSSLSNNNSRLTIEIETNSYFNHDLTIGLMNDEIGVMEYAVIQESDEISTKITYTFDVDEFEGIEPAEDEEDSAELVEYALLLVF